MNILRGAALAAAAITTAIAMHSCKAPAESGEPIDYTADRFADIEVLRYRVPGFESLPLRQKELIYHLSEAALWGRDMLWDQNNRYNLPIRRMLEAVYTSMSPEELATPQGEALLTYLKQIWFANGIHHHYSMDKFTPAFSREYLDSLVATLPDDARPVDREELMEVIFNPAVMAKRVNQAQGADLIATSANNLYAPGITQAEAEAYYAARKDTTDLHPVMHGLNTRLARGEDGKLYEQVYKVGGLYSPAIEHIVAELKLARPLADTPAQADVIDKLIAFYESGSLADFDTYSIAWAADTASRVDFINGFIESYGDPLGMTGAYESMVNYKNLEASHRTEVISSEAQWFEDHSPVAPRFRKPDVKGVTAKVINAAMLAGDAYPATPIGINLPNSNWIRAEHGSKSVTIENITQAYDEASHGNGFNEEFVPDADMRAMMDRWLFITDNMHTDLHECLGHGSGRLLPGVDPDALREHGSTLEEARADLFALYYLGDPKLVELGLLDSPDAYKPQYYKYLLNGLMTQLMRIEPGKDVEEAHMRNRKLIAEWVLEKGRQKGVVDMKRGDDGRTFIEITDYPALRGLFGELLAEVQRIRSEGDYEAGRALVERYGVRVDPDLHREVLERYSKLDIAPYRGFVNPVYTAVRDSDGRITDVTVSYTEPYVDQMLRYSRTYSPL